MKSKTLFVFRPSTSWGYCGGCVMATADSFDEVVLKLKEKVNSNPSFYHKESEVTDEHLDSWVLEYTLQLAEPQDIFFESWNDA